MKRLRAFPREPFIWFHLVPPGSIWFLLPPRRTDSAVREVQVPPPWQNMGAISSSAPRRVGIPLIPIPPTKTFLAFSIVCPLQRLGTCSEHAPLWSGQESAAEPPHQGSRPLARNPRSLVWGLPKWATAVSKSALIPRKLRLNKPGPGRVTAWRELLRISKAKRTARSWRCARSSKAHSPLVALCAQAECARRNFMAGGPKPATS